MYAHTFILVRNAYAFASIEIKLTYVRICHTLMHEGMHACQICVHVHERYIACVRKYVCVCMDVCVYACMHACMHAWMDGCMYVCMYNVCTHVCVRSGCTLTLCVWVYFYHQVMSHFVHLHMRSIMCIHVHVHKSTSQNSKTTLVMSTRLV